MAFYQNAISLARALQATTQRGKPGTTGKRVKDLLEANKLRKGSFDELFPSTVSIDGADIAELIEKSQKSKRITEIEAIIIKQVYKETVEYYSINSVFLTKARAETIIKEITDFVDTFNKAFDDPAQEFTDSLYQILDAKLKKLINVTIGQKTIYRLNYISASNEDQIGSLVLAGSGYSTVTQEINKTLRQKLTEKIEQYIKAEKDVKDIENLIKDSSLLTKILQNWGHAISDILTVDPETGEIGTQKKILTGKLIATLLSVGKGITEDISETISTNFIQNTGQINSSIKLINTGGTGDPGALSLVISSGFFQSVRTQFGPENLAQGQQEKAWSLQQLLQNNTFLLNKVKVALGVAANTSLIQTVFKLIKVSASPTYTDKIVDAVFSPLISKHKKLKYTPKNTNLLSSKHKVSKIFGTAKSKLKTKVSKPKSVVLKPTVTETTVNLPKLLLQLNSNLQEQIRKNMGTGDRRDVLNYRTGRFAQSAKVERLSESRQGMITAFYSYMKNPYATFSRGGRQERPLTRDPKLLISKSIRELAQPMVANRMRAVLV